MGGSGSGTAAASGARGEPVAEVERWWPENELRTEGLRWKLELDGELAEDARLLLLGRIGCRAAALHVAGRRRSQRLCTETPQPCRVRQGPMVSYLAALRLVERQAARAISCTHLTHLAVLADAADAPDAGLADRARLGDGERCRLERVRLTAACVLS